MCASMHLCMHAAIAVKEKVTHVHVHVWMHPDAHAYYMHTCTIEGGPSMRMHACMYACASACIYARPLKGEQKDR